MMVCAQKKVITKFATSVRQINISTTGLDSFIIENSMSEFIEIYLYAENISKQHIIFNEKYAATNIEFKIPEIPNEIPVFRKFITQRLERANAIVKIPQHKSVTIFGDDINITSKSYNGNLAVYINKGILKLHTIKETTNIKLRTGTVFASLKNVNTDVSTKNGIISIDDEIQQEKTYQKTENSFKKFTIETLKGNVYLHNL